eukprot:gnl/Dysnectes_brevis/3463_a4389_1258.p1 GENE.gnl/Dysnectes_brevis/3463_a4389_1258~~gnl/Dysnectes_brevis/3463_a4389_1258.p1  ORF type:complete len:318 (-),score=42.55 gnl/Dysnectes_brevis/3463_a4389_1258:36-989(-)
MDIKTFLTTWADVEPIDFDPEGNPVLPIKYPAQYKTVLGYFYAAISSGELSRRVYDATTYLLSKNPTNYSAFAVRRECIKHIDISVTDELKWATLMMLKMPKNYQLWNHRQQLLTYASSASASQSLPLPSKLIQKELAFTTEALKKDAKNYHCWGYRFWLLKTHATDNIPGDLEFTSQLISEDIRNNSAWSHRLSVFNLLHSSLSESFPLIPEVSFTIEKCKKAPMNESSWNHLQALIDLSEDPWALPGLSEVLMQYASSSDDSLLSPHALCVRAEICREAEREEVAGLMEQVGEFDTTRRGWWTWSAKQIREREMK